MQPKTFQESLFLRRFRLDLTRPLGKAKSRVKSDLKRLKNLPQLVRPPPPPLPISAMMHVSLLQLLATAADGGQKEAAAVGVPDGQAVPIIEDHRAGEEKVGGVDNPGHVPGQGAGGSRQVGRRQPPSGSRPLPKSRVARLAFSRPNMTNLAFF